MDRAILDQRRAAASLLKQLALGLDPQHGQALGCPALDRAENIRALVLAVEALQEVPNADKIRPERAGSAWSSGEDQELREMFQRRMQLKNMASELRRNTGGVASRLVRLGIVESRDEARRMFKAEL